MITRTLPIVIVLVAIGIFFGYINPLYTDKIVPLRAQIQQYDSALAAAQDFNNKEKELANQRNAIPNDSIVRLQTYLPDGVDNVQLILDLNALAAKSGVQLSNFDIKSSDLGAAGDGRPGQLPLQAATNAVESLDVTVHAVGSYNAFRTFLGGVEQSLRPLDIVQLNLGDSATGVYNYDITFRIYWLH